MAYTHRQLVVEFLIDKLLSSSTKVVGFCHGFSPRHLYLQVPLSQFACSFAGTPGRTHHGSFARAVTQIAAFLRKPAFGITDAL